MKTSLTSISLGTALAVATLTLSNCAHEPVTQANAQHANRGQITQESRAALNRLYAENPTARKLGSRATGVLVFPEILKGGFVVGAEGGNGTLFNSAGKATAYYQTAGASYGLQAGVQKYGYALFLMDAKEVHNLNQAAGWEVGASPSVVVVDQGLATSLSTKTAQKGTYAFFFDQKGLMAGVSLKGSKITKISPGN